MVAMIRGRSRAGGGDCQAARDQRADDLHGRKRFGGIEPNDVRRLKQLEVENAQLKPGQVTPIESARFAHLVTSAH